jgi:hypothetical protein
MLRIGAPPRPCGGRAIGSSQSMAMIRGYVPGIVSFDVIISSGNLANGYRLETERPRVRIVQRAEKDEEIQCPVKCAT